MSYATEWQRKKIAAGLCGICGKNPLTIYKWRCEKCQEKLRLAQRARRGWKPWRPGGRGRPPKKKESQ